MQLFASRPVLVMLAVAVLAVTAGCLSGPLGDDVGTNDDESPTTDAPTSDTPTTGSATGDGSTTPPSSNVSVTYLDDGPDVAADLQSPANCSDTGWVGYWGTGDTSMLWEPEYLRVGWTVPANQSTLFVAFENETAVGAAHEYYRRSSVTADGAGVPVDDPTGEGRYAVVMMLDVNGNGEYDPGTDRPCASDDDGDRPIVMTDWVWVDWNTTQ